MSASADDQYEQQNDVQQDIDDVPSHDNHEQDYKSRTGQSHIPVQSDNRAVEDPIDAETADSDETLAADERDAMNKGNIIDERTRGAAKPKGSYQEPGDDEGLPGPDDGTSAVAY